MLAAERRDLLVARLRRDGKLVARDLATEFGVSEDSVRRDLRELAAAGLCQRVHGGALPASPAIGTYTRRAGGQHRRASTASGRWRPHSSRPAPRSRGRRYDRSRHRGRLASGPVRDDHHPQPDHRGGHR